MTNQEDFDGCYRKCRVQGKHTLEYGRCEHADKPESTVSMSKVFKDADGYPSIGYDQYTVQQLAELIEPSLHRVGVRLPDGEFAVLARAAAYAIVHRNAGPLVEQSSTPERTGLQAERDMLGSEADRLRKDWIEMRDRAERAEAKLRRLTGEGEARTVAYQAADLDVLYCVQCCPEDDRFLGVESDDLPDGGICANCDTDVLIRVKPSPCPRCGEDVSGYRPDDLVYRVGDKRPYCSGECVVAAHRANAPTADLSDDELVEAARGIGLVEPEKAPGIVDAARRFLAQSGVDTPGCDCGHKGAGPAWHLKTCAWTKTLNVPHPDEVTRGTP